MVFDKMNIKYFFHIIFSNFEKESEEYKKQLVFRFLFIFLLSVVFSLILFFITKISGFLLVWLTLFAIFDCYAYQHYNVKKKLDIVRSNSKLAWIIYYLSRGILILVVVLNLLG